MNQGKFQTIFDSFHSKFTFYFEKTTFKQNLPLPITVIDSISSDKTMITIHKDMDMDLHSIEYGIDIVLDGIVFYPIYFDLFQTIHQQMFLSHTQQENKPSQRDMDMIISFKWNLVLSCCKWNLESKSVLNEFHGDKLTLFGNYIQGSPLFNARATIENAYMCFSDKNRLKPVLDEYFKLFKISFLEIESQIKVSSDPIEYHVHFNLLLKIKITFNRLSFKQVNYL